MATSSPLKDIGDKFCLCSICLEQLKEPKLLPCLHRYCKDCLNSIIQGTYDVIQCPDCRQETQIPTNGVDGFKTDFYSKNLVEYVQIQQSLKSDITVNYKQYSISKTSVTKISENFDTKISIYDPNRYVCSITSIGDGNIVISGYTSDLKASFMIVIDMNGRMLKEKILNTGEILPVRFCKFLSQHKVASVCTPNDIGLYDVRDGSYIKKNISDVISSWPKGRDVSCVATNPVNNHILVGGRNSTDVYVFDDQLNYLHILTLPEMIKRPHDITVSDGHLLVCDNDGEKCFVTTMDGSESKVVGEFMKPNLEGYMFGPTSVYSDKNGLVYVLWKSSPQCYIVQYNHDGSQVLTTRMLDVDAHVVTVVETSQGEKLLVATCDTRTVYLYNLMTED
ncbi:E3 ubiquitin-protein ligase TRIM56 [Holothuria leucospilota]|uniref:E3 ubiquitin-protein ligase TRIM56 n=1 Tax=Holothuria leucospilota TaxID=206669 RepID=A0A9Q1H2C6_HOLLE|nr:E3 ubiquitin-protein ligase TRIM56 [Holothuria leucospilota]